MGLILDGIIIIIILLCIIISARRGFIKTLIEAIGYVVSVCTALFAASPLAVLTYDKGIKPLFTTYLTEVLTKHANDISNNLPESFVKLMGIFSLTIEEINDSLVSGVDYAVPLIMNEISPFITNAIEAAFFTMIIVLLMIVARIIAKRVDIKCRDTSFGKTNRTIGGSIGLFKGMAFSVAFSFGVSLLALVSDNGFWIFTEESLEQSYICEFILDILALIF